MFEHVIHGIIELWTLNLLAYT